jgi:ADP-heptose:LPS heptosyltransferase
VQPTYNRFFLIEDALMRAAGGNDRIGSTGTPMFISPAERLISDKWYTCLVPCSPIPMHEIKRNQEFLQGMGLTVEQAWAQLPSTLIQEPDLRGQDKVILMSLSSSHPMKSWPLLRFEKLAHFMAHKTGYRIVFVGGTDETSPSQTFQRWNDTCFEDKVGSTDLLSLVQWIARAELVISNDSAIMHFAALMQRKVIVIAGGGIPKRYHPYPAEYAVRNQPIIVEERMPCYGCGWRCRYMNRYDKAAPCITSVPTSRVARAVLRALASNTN